MRAGQFLLLVLWLTTVSNSWQCLTHHWDSLTIMSSHIVSNSLCLTHQYLTHYNLLTIMSNSPLCFLIFVSDSSVSPLSITLENGLQDRTISHMLLSEIRKAKPSQQPRLSQSKSTSQIREHTMHTDMLWAAALLEWLPTAWYVSQSSETLN